MVNVYKLQSAIESKCFSIYMNCTKQIVQQLLMQLHYSCSLANEQIQFQTILITSVY